MTPPLVFAYLPKTGSSPFLTNLAKHLVWNEGIVYLGPWGDRQRHRQARPDISVWSRRKLAQVRVVTGSDIDMASHEVVGASAGRYLTVVRDPADRFVAEYNALLEAGNDLPEFFDWHDAKRNNQMTRHFFDSFGVDSADEVAERLRKFWFLTTTEHLGEDVPHFLRELELPADWDDGAGREGDLDDLESAEDGEVAFTSRDTTRRIEVSDDIRERIYAENPRDLRLYKLALKRRESRRARLGWD